MELGLHNLKPPKGARKKRKRVGRGPGSGSGKTSARGQDGQRARSGSTIHPWFEGGQMPLQRRVPKRGFKNRFREKRYIVNISQLNRFADTEKFTPEDMVKLGLIKNAKYKVKVLGNGDIDRKIGVKAHYFSKMAVEKIKAQGGNVEVI